MNFMRNPFILYGIYFLCVVAIAVFQSTSLALAIVSLGLISGIMAMGVNMQWGYAGLLNVGSMGFAAIGGAAAVWVAAEPVPAAWSAGGGNLAFTIVYIIITVVAVVGVRRYTKSLAFVPTIATVVIVAVGYVYIRAEFVMAVELIEAVDPAKTGYLGGLGAPIMFSWVVGGVIAAGAAWCVGKTALGLKADYLAIATLGISEILVSILKNEDWLTRGVKNVVGLPRPVPYEVELESHAWVVSLADNLGLRLVDMTSILVRLSYIGIFLVVIVALLWLANTAIKSPWGRMMWAIRDNETAARAMGKDVTKKHLAVFILGSGVVGLAGAMLVTLEGQFTPGSYNPLRFTFLIWIMVIIGGSGNNWGSVLGGLVVWMFWVEAEPIGAMMVEYLSAFLPEGNAVRDQLVANASQMRLTLMGILLLLVLRFNPKGLIPEKNH